MPDEVPPVCPKHQRVMEFDELSEQWECYTCNEEKREAISSARAQSPLTPEESFPGHPEWARHFRDKYMTKKAFDAAWTLLKDDKMSDAYNEMHDWQGVQYDTRCPECGKGIYREQEDDLLFIREMGKCTECVMKS